MATLQVKERIIDNSIICEELQQGYYRVVCQDGRSDCLRIPHDCSVGDKGRTYYVSDGTSYGLSEFRKDDSVEIDLEKLKENYKAKWNADLKI